MDSKLHTEMTELLGAMGEGDEEARERILTAVYDELRRMAHLQMRRERDDHTLNTTGLVHEAFIALNRGPQASWIDRSQFFAVASLTMRHILVNWARSKRRQKRGEGVAPLRLDEIGEIGERVRFEEVVAVDRALDRLAGISPRAATVVQYRYFGGLTVDETAAALDVSPATVKREWTLAKSWLKRELS